MPNWSPAETATQQHNDPSLNAIIQFLERSPDRPTWQDISNSSSTTKTLWRMWDRLTLDNDVLFKAWYDDDNHFPQQIIVPLRQRANVQHYMHDIPSSAHLETDKTLEKIRLSFYWHGMKNDIATNSLISTALALALLLLYIPAFCTVPSTLKQ